MKLDGKAVAAEIRSKLILPRKMRLAIVAGADAASAEYRRAKVKACEDFGVQTEIFEVSELKKAFKADVVLVELPLPDGVNERKVLWSIPPEKDVEGVTPDNFGRLMSARSAADLAQLPLPCTAAAVLALIQSTGMPIEGSEAVVIGRSNIVGKPAAHLLSLLGATVTLCHSKTRDLASHVRRADIIVSATGMPGLVHGDWIKSGAVVIDAAGDVDFEAAVTRAGWITPAKGGVGPVTTAMLLSNIALLAKGRL